MIIYTNTKPFCIEAYPAVDTIPETYPVGTVFILQSVNCNGVTLIEGKEFMNKGKDSGCIYNVMPDIFKFSFKEKIPS